MPRRRKPTGDTRPFNVTGAEWSTDGLVAPRSIGTLPD